MENINVFNLKFILNNFNIFNGRLSCYLYNVDFIKLKNISLGYLLFKLLIKKNLL